MSWKVYQQKDNYGCNMLETFKSFREAAKGSPLYTKGMCAARKASSNTTP